MRTVLALPLLLLCAVGLATAQVTFSSTRFDFTTPAAGTVSGDFNRDGRPDVAVTSGQGDTD